MKQPEEVVVSVIVDGPYKDVAPVKKDSRPCECCGKVTKNEDLNVCSSGLGACSFAYCNSCLHGGYEPYGAILGLLSCISIEGYLGDNEDRKAWLSKNLELHGKTMEDLIADVKRQNDEFDEWCRQMEDWEEPDFDERERMEQSEWPVDSQKVLLSAPKVACSNEVVTRPVEEF
jgi:hypothetical protein